MPNTTIMTRHWFLVWHTVLIIYAAVPSMSAKGKTFKGYRSDGDDGTERAELHNRLMWRAAQTGSAKSIKRALAAGANVNAEDMDHERTTALFYAVAGQHIRAIFKPTLGRAKHFPNPDDNFPNLIASGQRMRNAYQLEQSFHLARAGAFVSCCVFAPGLQNNDVPHVLGVQLRSCSHLTQPTQH